MLSLKKALSEIERLIKESEAKGIKPTHYKRLTREAAKLQNVVPYLETNPSADYLEREIARADKIIARIGEYFKEWCENNPTDAKRENPRAFYEKQMRLSDHRRHAKNARFILSK